MTAALVYLEKQKTVLYGAETIPMDVDPETGRVIGVHADRPYMVDRIISFITKAAQVRRVKTIPELTYPHVYVGDKMTGNNESYIIAKAIKSLSFR